MTKPTKLGVRILCCSAITLIMKLGTVADVSRGSEQNSAHLGSAAGKKFLHGGRLLDAETGAAKSVGKEHQVSWRIVEHRGQTAVIH